MNKIENILLQVLYTLKNSNEFRTLLEELPNCGTECIHLYVKQFFSECYSNPRVPQQLIQIFIHKNLKSQNFIGFLHVLLFGLHEHTLYHCKLSENSCPYHQVFSINYASHYSCNCSPNPKITEFSSFDLYLDISRIQEIQENHKKTLTWKKYLNTYEDHILNLAFTQDCSTPACKYAPDLKYVLTSSSKNILFSIKLKNFPNFQENLRIFSMFPKTLKISELNKSYEIFSYLLISPHSYGSLQYFKYYNSWVLIHNLEIKIGKFNDLLEKIVDEPFTPIHVFYSETFENFEDFKDQKFYSLILKGNTVNNSAYNIEDYLGKRNFEENSTSFWVCSCKIVNFSECCSNCGRTHSKNLLWTCVCMRTCNKLVCVCGKQIPKCSSCQRFFSWTNVFCLRCKGVIKNGKCKVCGLVQDNNICSKCVSETWRCKVCCYPNKDSVFCVRCSNPNKKKIILDDEMPSFIKLNFED